jgi:hypothetical protein
VLIDFLKVNLDVFAWKPSDMKGILREVVEHKLNIKLGLKPVKQSFAASTTRSARRSTRRSRSSLVQGSS